VYASADAAMDDQSTRRALTFGENLPAAESKEAA